MTQMTYAKFTAFLREELAIPCDSISVIDRHWQKHSVLSPLPMILWQYGLVTLEQLDRIYDWLANA